MFGRGKSQHAQNSFGEGICSRQEHVDCSSETISRSINLPADDTVDDETRGELNKLPRKSSTIGEWRDQLIHGSSGGAEMENNASDDLCDFYSSPVIMKRVW